MTDLSISEVRFVAANPRLRETGVEGWTSFTLSDRLRVDGVAVRRDREGRRYLAFPSRWDEAGREHPFIRPLGPDDRAEVERRVFEAIRISLEAAP